jgi:hypothetical protein
VKSTTVGSIRAKGGRRVSRRQKPWNGSLPPHEAVATDSQLVVCDRPLACSVSGANQDRPENRPRPRPQVMHGLSQHRYGDKDHQNLCGRPDLYGDCQSARSVCRGHCRRDRISPPADAANPTNANRHRKSVCLHYVAEKTVTPCFHAGGEGRSRRRRARSRCRSRLLQQRTNPDVPQRRHRRHASKTDAIRH